MFTAVDTNLRHVLQASMADLDLSANHFSRNYEIVHKRLAPHGLTNRVIGAAAVRSLLAAA